MSTRTVPGPAGGTGPPVPLPAPLTSRPLVPADSRAVFELMAAQELADVGEIVIEEADLVADWQRPSHDLAASSVAVLDGERIVGYAEADGERGDAAVHPDYRGRGIGTWLAHRMQDLARAQGAPRVGMPVPEGSPGDRLLTSLGYGVRWRSWVLQLPPGARVPERPLPPGHRVRSAREDERRVCWTLLEDAFLEWADRERESFADWTARVTERPGFEPWHLRVVVDPQDRVVACAVVLLAGDCGYVDRLATRRDQRDRGFAQALLVDAFAAARAHGATRSELSTDSRTGALGLYERVGMVLTSTWLHRAIAL
ncbi:GNAT family N-acetyltransferase [Nocardioides sp. dk4132]|uniref:GNAT family N-acetyltransferase n=1 Tax=unclassified Nocardioides TaxID=2615069 RepID=UPI001296A81C|nr:MULTISPECIES: GNAT family N-acetyltransferase [unclassified Nocardioides]MQW76991.1 GNAT family N-acetyltransferase [Nocardioides sp. dk4132]QGA09405.1 GNAT family N-acetyltransferase [Nocardioides sp. dk884]